MNIFFYALSKGTGGSGGGGGDVPGGLAQYNGALIATVGNSLTYGLNQSLYNPYPAQLASLLADAGVTGISMHNLGQNSAKSTDLISNLPGQLYPLFDSGRKCITIVNEVGNSLFYDGNVTSAVNDYKTLCQDCKNHGFIVFSMGMADRGLLPPSFALATPFGDNLASYRSKWQDAENQLDVNPTDYCHFRFRLVNDLLLSDYSNLTYFLDDQTHNTNLGYARYAANCMTKFAAVTLP